MGTDEIALVKLRAWRTLVAPSVGRPAEPEHAAIFQVAEEAIVGWTLRVAGPCCGCGGHGGWPCRPSGGGLGEDGWPRGGWSTGCASRTRCATLEHGTYSGTIDFETWNYIYSEYRIVFTVKHETIFVKFRQDSIQPRDKLFHLFQYLHVK